MLYLIAASLLTLGTLADLEGITEEWMAPGIDISKDTLLEFADYGEMFQSDYGFYVGSHVAFVEVNGQEKWRAVVVYADRVVLFQEDQEPIVTLHDFPVENCSFSESGRYVVLHDGGAIDTDRNALRLNAETGSIQYFDSEPDGFLGNSDFNIWEDGSLAFGRAIIRDAYIYRVFFFDSNLQYQNSYDAIHAYNEKVTDTQLLLCLPGRIVCLTNHGELLWEQPLDSRSLESPVVSNDGFFLLPTYTSLECRSLQTGEIIRTFPFKVISVTFLPDSHDWLCLKASPFPRQALSGSADSDLSNEFAIPYPDNYTLRFLQTSWTNQLVILQTISYSVQRTLVVVDHEYHPLYSIPREFGTGVIPSLSGISTNEKLSASGSVFLYTADNSVFLIKIGE
jgi:hypothetical protein